MFQVLEKNEENTINSERFNVYGKKINHFP